MYRSTGTNMISFKEIKNRKRVGDYTEVGDLVGLSAETVRKVVAGKRTDIDNRVSMAFEILFRQRDLIRHSTQQELEEEFEALNHLS